MTKGTLDIDRKDRELLSMLEKNPEISQNDIAKQLGISQPSVSARMHKLKQRGILSIVAGMNFKKVNLYLAKVDITASNTAEIINTFKDCPYFLNGLIVSGKNNLCLFFAGEDIATLEAIVDGHLRNDPKVKEAELSIVINPASDLVLPVKMGFVKKDKAPCNSDCSNCSYFTSDRCLGCPIIDCYKGDMWR